MKDMPAFTSPLKKQFEQYLKYKWMQGYKFIAGEDNIRRFDAYIAALPNITDRLTKELVEAYIAHRPGEKPTT